MKKQPIGQILGRVPSTARVVTVADVHDPETNPEGQIAVSADLSEKQDKLIAGENITIAEDGKTIGVTPDTFVKMGAMSNMQGDINKSVRLVNRVYEGEEHFPIFRLGSQHADGDIRTDRWMSDIFYDSIRFTGAPGVHTRLSFKRNEEDSIVRKAEMDAAIGDINSILEAL